MPEAPLVPRIPAARLPEMTLRAPPAVPPIVVEAALNETSIPCWVFGSAPVPAAFVPIQLPATRIDPVPAVAERCRSGGVRADVVAGDHVVGRVRVGGGQARDVNAVPRVARDHVDGPGQRPAHGVGARLVEDDDAVLSVGQSGAPARI